MMLIPSVRKIHNTRSNKVIGYSYIFKMHSLIAWESTFERDYLYHLEANPDIRYIYSQPKKFSIFHEGVWHRYTPDFQTIGLNEQDSIFYEVKPSDIAMAHDWKGYLESIRVALAMLGFEFVVVTENEIRLEPNLSNLKKLRAYAGEFVELEIKKRICDWILAHPNGCIQQLSLEAAAPLQFIFSLMWNGTIQYDNNKKISLVTQLSLKKEV
jgi:hypothetical protein